MRAVLFILLISSSGLIKAQEDWNLHAYGIGQNTMLLNKADSDSSTVLYRSTYAGAFGVGVNYYWNKKWGVGLDAIYSFQGQEKEYGLNDTLFIGIFENVKLQYLKIPVTARYRSDSDTRFRYRATFGPTVMVLVDATKKQTVPSKEAEGDAKSEFNQLNWGLFTSQGVQFKIGKKIWLNFDLIADWGISDAEDKDAVVRDLLFETSTLYPDDRPSTHNVTIGASFGAELILGKRTGVVRNR